MNPSGYKKRVIDMNRVKKLQELRMITPFFKDDPTNESKKKRPLNIQEPIVKEKETPIVPLTEETKKVSPKIVRIFNTHTTKEKPKPSYNLRKTAYEIMREKVEDIKEKWMKKKETIKTKQTEFSSIPKQTDCSNQSKIDAIKEKWKKKGATID